MTIASRKQILGKPSDKFKDDDSNSTDFTEKFSNAAQILDAAKVEPVPEAAEVKAVPQVAQVGPERKQIEPVCPSSVEKPVEKLPRQDVKVTPRKEISRTRSPRRSPERREKSPKRRRESSPIKRREISPRRGRASPCRRRYSPGYRGRNSSPRREYSPVRGRERHSSPGRHRISRYVVNFFYA